MTLHAQEHHSARRKGCYAIARQRARQARRNGKNRLLIALIFAWALLTGPFPSWPAARLPGCGPVPKARLPGSPEVEDWPITEYERGGGGQIVRAQRAASRTARYRTRPTLWRLMTDLRRPAARKDAAAELGIRIDDPITRAWAQDRIAKDEINRLSIWVQPGRADETVMAAWQGEAAAALVEAEANIASPTPDRGSLLQVAKLLETLAGVDTVTWEGPKGPNARGKS